MERTPGLKSGNASEQPLHVLSRLRNARGYYHVVAGSIMASSLLQPEIANLSLWTAH